MIDERSCDRDTLPLSTRQLIRPVHYAVAKLHGCKCGLGLVMPLTGTHSGVDQRQLDIVKGSRTRRAG